MKDIRGEEIEVGDIILAKDNYYRYVLAINDMKIYLSVEVKTINEVERTACHFFWEDWEKWELPDIDYFKMEVVQKRFLGLDRNGKKVYKGDMIVNVLDNQGVEVFGYIKSQNLDNKDGFLVKKETIPGGWLWVSTNLSLLVKSKYPREDWVDVGEYRVNITKAKEQGLVKNREDNVNENLDRHNSSIYNLTNTLYT